MKKTTWLYIAAAAAVYYWWARSKKMSGASSPSARQAASQARNIVADTIDQTTFLPDTTTDADRYAADKNACK
jgi:flagellar basal body-associated protein FliL